MRILPGTLLFGASGLRFQLLSKRLTGFSFLQALGERELGGWGNKYRH
jgi:hypothetical protein